jgi:GntR family transcriptional regulator
MTAPKIQLDFRANMPIYLQIVEQIENLLLTGDLTPGDQLPPIRQLASELDVNFNTVARSYRLLDESGLISTQHGRGTFILDRPAEEVQRRLKNEALRVLTQRFLCETARLGITPEEAGREVEKQVAAWHEGKTSASEPPAGPC